MKKYVVVAVLLCGLLVAGMCSAQSLDPSQAVKSPLDTGDTAWMLVSIAFVMLMTPGLAFFYGGMVRRKNVLGVLMQCFIMVA